MAKCMCTVFDLMRMKYVIEAWCEYRKWVYLWLCGSAFVMSVIPEFEVLATQMPFSWSSQCLTRIIIFYRMELEADYIGLLLLSSAGYDPRTAPKVYEKLGKVAKDSTLQDYLSTHPSGKKRAQLLAQAQVMEEALMIYREVSAGRGVEGFL
ncbi:metalloendopeptidase OMA1, mitochondrial-like [Gossypium australe]|uniref:Metalloendopeptidase OMA1, mitochondrial-like n=1 Tax=Gossypium australe TaxID=47621 RepID=A0A5B6UDN9_9ROSI|nr:metalloendopeptidase OMA1, mitochondrial-like [Gossypium australe]